MKPKLVSLVLACLVATAAAQMSWQEEPRKPRALVYALEGLGALGAAAGCAGCGIGFTAAASLGAALDGTEDHLGAAVAVAAVAAAPASAGYNAAKVGEQLGEDGSTGWAVAGAYIGTAVGAGIIALGAYVIKDDRGQRIDAVFVPACVLGGLCLPAAAVVGYNLGTNGGGLSGDFGGRLQPPGVALTSVELLDHSVEYGAKVQLAGLRF